MKPMTEAHLAILRRHMVEVIDMHFDLAADEIGRDALGPNFAAPCSRAPPPVRAAPAGGRRLSGHAASDRLRQDHFAAVHRRADARAARPRPGAEGARGRHRPGLAGGGDGRARRPTCSASRSSRSSPRRPACASLDHDVEIRVGDGSRGWTTTHRSTGSWSPPPPPSRLRPWSTSSRPGGRMVIPLGGKEVQQLSVVEKKAAARSRPARCSRSASPSSKRDRSSAPAS